MRWHLLFSSWKYKASCYQLHSVCGHSSNVRNFNFCTSSTIYANRDLWDPCIYHFVGILLFSSKLCSSFSQLILFLLLLWVSIYFHSDFSKAPVQMRSATQSLNLLTSAIGSLICVPLVVLVNINPNNEWLPSNLVNLILDMAFIWVVFTSV